MDYISIKETAVLWNIDISRVGRLAREGRIEGARLVGRKWMIPKQAQKPTDGRTKKGKAEEKTPCFRFPLLINREEKDFYPVLSDEEKLLRNAELDYYAFEFEKADAAFEDLLKNTQSIYIKIMVLYYLCCLSVEAHNGRDFKVYYNQLQFVLAGDFPYKREMELVLPLLYTALIQYQMTADSFTFDLSYDYSETVLPLLSYLSVFHLAGRFRGEIDPVCFEAYELLCRRISRENAYYEACELHFLLFSVYYLTLNEEAMLYHLRKGMDIAKERNIPLLPSCYMPYYSDAFRMVAKEYPDEYMSKIKQCAKLFGKSYGRFTENNGFAKLYSRISGNDYRYVLFAIKGLSNKQVAHICNLSERTVAKNYHNIYEKLGFRNKQELVNELGFAIGGKA